MIKRNLETKVLAMAEKFPIVAILGPRQSGKTTLARTAFSKYNYVNLEDPLTYERAIADTKRFITSIQNEHGVIIDEIQNIPVLFSYLQVIVDETGRNGSFIITGSQNYLLNEAISQSLAGRVSIQTLLPLSVQELKSEERIPQFADKFIYTGMYPRVLHNGLDPSDWFQSYLQTVIEKDIRLLKNVADLSLFKKFVGLCAGRIGQLLNVSSLATECAISVKTVNSWISLLETSYIIFLLQPYYKNFSKRLIKSPKLFFYDTGLACQLLGIQSHERLATDYMRGNLFESFIMSELQKKYFNQGRLPAMYFWRDQHGHEVDCILDRRSGIVPVEIKSGMSITSSYFDKLSYWNKLTGNDPDLGVVIYGGEQEQRRQRGRALGWMDVDKIEV